MPPDSSLAQSASARIRCLYSAVKPQRLALATTTGLEPSATSPRSPPAALRSSSLRSNALYRQGQRVCLRVIHAECPSRPAL
jgi:hypothetical protein